MISEATLIGNIKDKELKEIKSGGRMIALEISTNIRFKDKDGNAKIRTTLHTVHCFNVMSEIAEKYLSVGDLVYIQGEIKHTKVEKGYKEEPIYYYSVTASKIKLLKKSVVVNDTIGE